MRTVILLVAAFGIFLMSSCGTPPPPLPGWYLEWWNSQQDGGGNTTTQDASANTERIQSEDPSGDEPDSSPDKPIVRPPPPRKPCPDNDKDGYGPKAYSNLLRCQGIYKDNRPDCNDNNGSIYPGAPQQCNGEDNDCDGQIDSGMTKPCKTACGTGTNTCEASGKWGECSARKPSPKEVCDSAKVDENCNGQINEGCECVDVEVAQCGQGPCPLGKKQCQDGKWGQCVGNRQPSKEICDGTDNNCSGQVDDLPPQQCSTKCGTGTETCTGGKWVGCTAQKPEAEKCDGKDNNCDGQTDETCPCIHGKKYPCGKDTGECKKGTQLCQNGKLGACNGQGPKPETCNNKDDNCNGAVDENVTQPCSTACGKGTQTCSKGSWSLCSNRPQKETCNNKDDDCNGMIDDGITKSCQTACGTGTETCLNGLWKNCTAPPVLVEKCNNVDDNCNGTIDENLKQTCKTACGTGVATCSKGKWINCDAPKVLPEICNNKDDNCNGTTDEGLTQSCKTACGTGTETCRAGKWVQCDAQQPAAEVCDAAFKDENCDGRSNEGCQCVNGRTQPCGSDVGACKKGTQLCTKGKWGTCSGEQKASTETCNNIDDDCNGSIDNGITPRQCSTICGKGNETCEKGQWVKCTARKPSAEICNNADDNCDGQIDNGIAARPCGSGIGICTKGTETCSAGQWVNCTSPKAKTEVCNGLDDNCDGQVDNNLTAPLCSKQLGICKGKVKVCGGTQGWLPCTATQYGADYQAGNENHRCDLKDNDCDGQVDENITRSCGFTLGICRQGTETCSNGVYVGCTAITPKTETCNGLDDDCNGQIDNGIAARYCSNSCRTRQTCTNGVWGPTCLTPSTETCNGKDDDCDGSTDEGTDQTCSYRCFTGNYVTGYRICSSGSLGSCYDRYGYCPRLGDGKCETSKGETCNNSSSDCRCSSGYDCKYQSGRYQCVRRARCGDGICNGSDTQSNCCQDCGCPSGQQCVGSSSKSCKPRYSVRTVGTGCVTNHSNTQNEGTLCLRIDYSGSGKTFYAYLKKQRPGHPWRGNAMDALINMYNRNSTCNVTPTLYHMGSHTINKGYYDWSGRIKFDLRSYSCPGIGSSKTIYIRLRSPHDCYSSVCYFNSGDVVITRNW